LYIVFVIVYQLVRLYYYTCIYNLHTFSNDTQLEAPAVTRWAAWLWCWWAISKGEFSDGIWRCRKWV